MSGFNKILIIISVLLLGVTTVEIFIYQGYFFTKTEPVKKNSVQIATPSKFKAFMGSDIIDPVNLRFVYAKKGILMGSVVTNTYRGKVTSIDNTPGKLLNTNFEYIIKIRLTAENGVYNDFYYNKNDLLSLKNAVDSQIEKDLIKIEDLKIGDRVTFVKTFDLLKDSSNSTLEFKILKNP